MGHFFCPAGQSFFFRCTSTPSSTEARRGVPSAPSHARWKLQLSASWSGGGLDGVSWIPELYGSVKVPLLPK
jgi:hypothetical protein